MFNENKIPINLNAVIRGMVNWYNK
jgi:hypothetical protein